MLSLKMFGFALTLSLTGCALALPFKGPGYDADSKKIIAPSSDKVVVALTHVVVDKQKRDKVDDHSKKIVDVIDQTPGYIGGSFRIEFFGDQLWTMTVWKDKESMDKFVNGRMHLDAMYQGASGARKMRSKVFLVSKDEIPISWDRALKELETEELTSLQYLN